MWLAGFILTFVTKREHAHCYVFSVVWQRVDYGISCSAVDTTYKRVFVSAVVFVFKFFFTIRASCQIGSDERNLTVVCRVNDFKFRVAFVVYFFFIV